MNRSASPALGARLDWHTVPIVEIEATTPRVKSFTFGAEGFGPFRAGQSVIVRLTAADGYQAQRSYSIASSPGALPRLELMVERLDDGEVSSFFHDAALPGDTIELRGPIGAALTWAPADGGPLLLVGGGSGVVPLLAMLRHRRSAARQIPATLVYSVRTLAEAIGLAELQADAADDVSFRFVLAVTRVADGPLPDGAHARRIDRLMIEAALATLPRRPGHVFVCGSTAFVEAATDLLVDAGLPTGLIRTERFG